MEKALENEVILRHLFRFLSTPDLLQCSLVNKQWNFEARSFVRDFRKCFARVADCNQEKTLSDLNQALSGIAVAGRAVPYNGLYLYIGEVVEAVDQVCLRSTWNLDFIEAQWPLKFLKICWLTCDVSEACPCARFIPTLLTKHSETLEEIIIESLPLRSMGGRLLYQDDRKLAFDGLFGPDGENTDYGLLRNVVLPKLRKLKWQGMPRGIYFFLDTKFLRWILHAGAPGLEELDIPLQRWPGLDDWDFVPTEKLKLLKRFYLVPTETHPPRNLDMLAANPKLSELHVAITNQTAEWDIVIQILQQSSETLEALDFPSLDGGFVPDITRRMPVLPMLKELHLFLTWELLMRNQNYRDHIASIDFARLFPKSEFRLNIHLVPEELTNTIWVSRDVPGQEEEVTNGGGSCLKNLIVTSSGYLHPRLSQIVPALSTMFPNVETLSVPLLGAELDACLWTEWRYLRSISLGTLQDEPLTFGDFSDWKLESVLCGIHPEEVAELRQMSDDYLRKVHIVPSKPPLSYSRGLQSLRMKFNLHGDIDGAAWRHRIETSAGPELLSRVSYFLVFKRMTGLKVALESSPQFLGIDDEPMEIDGKVVSPEPLPLSWPFAPSVRVSCQIL